MMLFEYKVVPAPERGKKSRGARSAPDRFAGTLESLMNELAQEGWEYHRAETLPSEERSGLTGRTTVYRNLLIFRRPDRSGAMVAPPSALEESEADPKAEPPRKTEAQRARTAGLRAILPAALTPKAPEPEAADTVPDAPAPDAAPSAPSAEEAAAAAAAAALRSVKPPEKKPATGPLAGEKPGLVSLMADKRASRPSK